MDKNGYIRTGVYSFDDVHKYVEIETTNQDLVSFDKDLMKMGSDRYKTFKFKGSHCVKCNINGVFYAKERFKRQSKIESFHFNLYAIDKDEVEVLMAKDHIIPKSKGGLDCLYNYQPMYTVCNRLKGNKI